MSSTAPSSTPVERIKAVNHHLRVALDQVTDGVLILQAGTGQNDGPVIVWGNEAAVHCTGLTAAVLSGARLQPLLTETSWQSLLTAMPAALKGEPSDCVLTFLPPATRSLTARVKATLGTKGEILGIILTLQAGAPSTPATLDSAPRAGEKPAALPRETVSGQPAPSPQGWQEDVIETIRETARQVAHEFNNALTSIVLPVQLAIRAIPRNGDLFDSLDVAHVSAQRASDLAKDFLDCFRPRSAVRSRCAPSALLGRSFRLATCAQNVSASLEMQENLPEIEVDESQLERVIFNLIRNSVQAMPSGGRLRVAAMAKEVEEGDPIGLPQGTYLQISVRDWGPGIPEEHLQHLFHGRFTTKPQGNGCGLPICYQIVRDHGGEMRVRSRVNVGTEFLIYLPVVSAEAADENNEDLGPPVSDFIVLETGAVPPAIKGSDPAGPTPGPGEAGGPSESTSPAANFRENSPVSKQESASAAALTSPLAPLVPLTAPVPPVSAPVTSPGAPPANTAPLKPLVPLINTVGIPAPLVPPADASPAPVTAPVSYTTPVRIKTAPVIPSWDSGNPQSENSTGNDRAPMFEELPPSLLVVDDEQGVRTALSQIAKVMGFDVVAVATSDEALQIYKDRLYASRPFSTVLLDLNLRSGLNGLEVFQAIRRMDPEAQVVATSGQHTEGDLERFRLLGFAGFLPKPYSLEHFDSVMRAALA